MKQQAIINTTVQILNQLPLDKAEEVSHFAQFILKQYEEELLTLGIQKLTAENSSFNFLKEDEGSYTLNDVKERYNG
jgi:hypothetical protein